MRPTMSTGLVVSSGTTKEPLSCTTGIAGKASMARIMSETNQAWEPEHVLVGDHLAEQFGGRAPELAAGHGVGAVAEHDGAMAQPPILAKSF